MGYTKIISYGNTLEVYEYEKDVFLLVGKGGRETEDRDDDESCGVNRKNTLQERNSEASLGKRSDNARRASMAFRRIVAANLGGSARPLLVTITYADNFTDLKQAYRHFSAFIQSLRYRFGKDFKYISVPEFQKRGAVHFHALIWGLPEELFSLERETRTLAEIWGKGFVYLKETDGDEKLSFYLSKYMAKAFLDPRLKNQKCYVASRNVERPTVHKGNFSASLMMEEFGVEEEPIIDRSYQTKWLGEGRYRLYKIQND
jgi:hypothetical protein